jgi:fructokinase
LSSGEGAFRMERGFRKKRIMEAGILHFGSATALLADPFQSTYLNIMQAAKQEDKFISFDPNYRKDLWKGRRDDFIDLAQKGIAIADFVKVSDEELKIISGMNDIREGIAAFHQLGAQAVAVTLGKEGTLISNGQKIEIVPSIKVDSIDSTGAGDAFVGAALYQLALEEEPKRVLENFEQLKKIISFSNKVGAIVCTKVGAISALPTQEEVHQL